MFNKPMEDWVKELLQDSQFIAAVLAMWEEESKQYLMKVPVKVWNSNILIGWIGFDWMPQVKADQFTDELKKQICFQNYQISAIVDRSGWNQLQVTFRRVA